VLESDHTIAVEQEVSAQYQTCGVSEAAGGISQYLATAAMLKKGQKVRLNARGRHFYEVSIRVARPRVIDWKLRLGTVGHITRDRKRASVLWEDNITLSEPLPLMFLEAIEAPT
jgi:hypothetical protein